MLACCCSDDRIGIGLPSEGFRVDILGFAVRPLASLGALYALGLWIGLYRHPNEWPWEYIFLATVQGMLAVHAAGRSLGLDALLQWRARKGVLFPQKTCSTRHAEHSPDGREYAQPTAPYTKAR